MWLHNAAANSAHFQPTNVSQGASRSGHNPAYGTFRTPPAQHLRDWDERRQAGNRTGRYKAARPRDLLAHHGIDCLTVTGAATGTFEFEAASGVYTELQCGSYIFMDADYRFLGEDLCNSGAVR